MMEKTKINKYFYSNFIEKMHLLGKDWDFRVEKIKEIIYETKGGEMIGIEGKISKYGLNFTKEYKNIEI